MARSEKFKLQGDRMSTGSSWQHRGAQHAEFDARRVEPPKYQFKAPLSQQVVNLNLAELSRTDKHWREVVSVKPVDATENAIISRLIELERLQRRTIEMERDKRLGIRGPRARSAVHTKVHASRTRLEVAGCSDCLRTACPGNCPSRRQTLSEKCSYCSDNNCTRGSCQSYSHTEPAKAPEKVTGDDEAKPKLLRQNSRILNADNRSVRTRPKSSYSIYKSSSFRFREPIKSGQWSSHWNPTLETEFAKLGVVDLSKQQLKDSPRSVQDRPSTGRRIVVRRPVTPADSGVSTARPDTAVLTEQEKEERIRLAVVATKKRLRSARRKRPKTAL